MVLRKFLRLKILVTITVLGLAVFLAYYFYAIGKPVSSDTGNVRFVVEIGESSSQVIERLQSQGLVKSSLIAGVYAWRHSLDDKIQAREFSIPKNTNIVELYKILTARLTRPVQRITIIEGWNIREIADYLESEGISSAENFKSEVQKRKDYWNDYEFLKGKPSEVDLEGYLFPDTYEVYSDSDLAEVAQRILDNFDLKVGQDIRSEILRQGKSLHETLTLASIIEKEVRNEADRKIVSGIFHNRLKIGMALQADSTVNYVTGKSTPRASSDDLNIDSPYNTYKYPGLPPGPISNPGLSSILAAVYPDDVPYFYFLTTPDGEALFSRTLQEHAALKRKYYP